MATSRFVYPLQPLLTALTARESAARLRHAQAAATLGACVRELVALERSAGRLASVLGRGVAVRSVESAALAWEFGEIDRRLARLEAVRIVRLAQIDAARKTVDAAQTELALLVRRRRAIERHRRARFERHQRALEAGDEAEREEAAELLRGSASAGCEVLSA
jgi:hypothetical protein